MSNVISFKKEEKDDAINLGPWADMEHGTITEILNDYDLCAGFQVDIEFKGVCITKHLVLAMWQSECFNQTGASNVVLFEKDTSSERYFAYCWLPLSYSQLNHNESIYSILSKYKSFWNGDVEFDPESYYVDEALIADYGEI